MLIVDDDTFESGCIKSLMDWELIGIQIVGDAVNGSQGLSKVIELNPDIVLADVKMPVMDGIEMSRKIRNIAPDIKIIFLSSYDDFEYAKQAINLKASAYVTKPVNEVELLKIVKSAADEITERALQEKINNKLDKNYKISLFLARQAIVSQVLNGTRTDKSEAENMGLGWLHDSFHLCLLLSFFEKDNTHKVNEGIHQLNSRLSQNYSRSISVCLNPGVLITLVSFNTDIRERDIQDLTDFLINLLREKDCKETRVEAVFDNAQNINPADQYLRIIQNSVPFNTPSALLASEGKKMKQKLVEQIEEIVNTRYNTTLTIESIAREIHFTPNYIGSIFRAEKKISINRYLMNVRLQKAVELLHDEKLSLNDIAALCGYENITILFLKRNGESLRVNSETIYTLKAKDGSMKIRRSDLKFKTQLFIDFAIVILLVSFLILIGLYMILWNNYRIQASKTLKNQAGQIAINIDNKMDYYLSLANLLILNSNLIQSLEEDDFANAEFVLNRETKKLSNLNTAKVHEIKLYRNDATAKNELNASILHVFNQLDATTDIIWSGTYLNDHNEKVFSLFQKIYQTNLNSEYILEISIYETELLAFFNRDPSGNEISVTNNGMLMSYSKRNDFYNLLVKQGIAYPLEVQSSTQSTGKKVINGSALCKLGWEVRINADFSSINRSFLSGYLSILPALFIAMAVAFIFISLISKRLNERMQHLHEKITYLSQWDLTKDLRIDGSDEFKVLSDVLDDTRKQILSLIDQINRTNDLKRIAEMTALRSQIKSHFLFNALSTIKWLSRQNDQKSLSLAVDKLSYILRYSLSLDEDYVLLSNEVEHLKSYVFFEQLRHSDGITVHVDIDEDLYPCKTIKLILQPLVENSIYHGRREDGSPLNITIYSYDTDTEYFLIVEDDGNGMTEQKIQEVYSAKNAGSENKDDGYGLKNVIKRLSELTILSDPGHFTKTTIRQLKQVSSDSMK
jgi:YesN/AraC family two-component response regulator/sensor histidine kinase YesM